jgi:hypothetical protein
MEGPTFAEPTGQYRRAASKLKSARVAFSGLLHSKDT